MKCFHGPGRQSPFPRQATLIHPNNTSDILLFPYLTHHELSPQIWLEFNRWARGVGKVGKCFHGPGRHSLQHPPFTPTPPNWKPFKIWYIFFDNTHLQKWSASKLDRCRQSRELGWNVFMDRRHSLFPQQAPLIHPNNTSDILSKTMTKTNKKTKWGAGVKCFHGPLSLTLCAAGNPHSPKQHLRHPFLYKSKNTHTLTTIARVLNWIFRSQKPHNVNFTWTGADFW